MWQFKLTKVKENLNISSSVTPVTFQMFNSPMWLVATVLDSKDIEYFYNHRKFYWDAA